MNPPLRRRQKRPATRGRCTSLTLALSLTGSVSLAATDHLASATDVSHPSVHWNTNPAHWERMIKQRPPPAGVRIGKSDFTLSGPLVDGLRRSRATGERSLGRRLVSLPIVRLLVPQPVPSPPGDGPYLRWGEREASWAVIARAPAPPGNSDNPIHREVGASLISVGLR